MSRWKYWGLVILIGLTLLGIGVFIHWHEWNLLVLTIWALTVEIRLGRKHR